MLRFCAIINILTGIIGGLFCVGFGMLAIGLSGGGRLSPADIWELVRQLGPMGMAGILFCWSGVALWRSLPAVPKKSVVLMGCALGFCLAYCIQFMVMLDGRFGPGGVQRQAGDPFDEEVVMFLFIPLAVILLFSVPFEYLRRKAKHQA